MKKLLISLILIPSLVLAECPNVQPIKQGDVAACSGFLFSDLAEKQAAQARDDAKFYQTFSEQLSHKVDIEANQNTILEKRLKLYMDESEVLSKRVANTETTETLYRLAYFTLGVVVTSLVVRNVRP